MLFCPSISNGGEKYFYGCVLFLCLYTQTVYGIGCFYSDTDNRLLSFLAKEELSIGGISFTTVDLGGHMTARRVWKEYFPAVDAIVYIIDAFDKGRFLESKEELDVSFRVCFSLTR